MKGLEEEQEGLLACGALALLGAYVYTVLTFNLKRFQNNKRKG